MQPEFMPPPRSLGAGSPAQAALGGRPSRMNNKDNKARGNMMPGRGSPSNQALSPDLLSIKSPTAKGDAGRNKREAPPAKGAEGEAIRERFEEQFFKTKLCVFWEKGRCVRGNMCKYAHGQNELQAMPDLTNTAMCRMMAETGRCDRPNCLYAHNHESLRATDNFYKTTMCSFFRFGRCRLGALCRHAHSENELRKAKDKQAADEAAAAAERAAASALANGTSNAPKGRSNDANSSTSASGSNESHKDWEDPSWQQQTDNEDTGSDFGECTFWDRIATMPAAFDQRPLGHGNFVPQRHAADDNYLRAHNIGRRGNFAPKRSKPLWADLQEEDDEFEERMEPSSQAGQACTTDNLHNGWNNNSATSFDDLPDMGDMWARMQTMPAALPARMNFGAPGPQRNPPVMVPKQQVVMVMMPVSQMQAVMSPNGGQPMIAANFSGVPYSHQPSDGSVFMPRQQSDGSVFMAQPSDGSIFMDEQAMPQRSGPVPGAVLVPAQGQFSQGMDLSGMGPTRGIPAMCLPMQPDGFPYPKVIGS